MASSSTNLIIAAVLLVLALVGIVARKTYFYLPLRELKRRAEKHDRQAARLYRAAAYGSSLKALLWLYIGLTGAASLILLARRLPVWAGLLIVGPLLWVAFSLIPATRVTKVGAWVTRVVTPPLVWLLNYLHPWLERGSGLVEDRYLVPQHTRLFEREDLLDLITRQQHQPDNRLTDEELEIVRRALRFDDYKVSDVMTPRKKVKTILADDVIGPVLIDEIHKSGHDCALVRESKKGPFVGTLALKRLSLESSGKVSDHMEQTVYYLNENDPLGQALHAFFVTNHSQFVVINSSEEYVGVLTIEDILRQLLGHVPGDDFDQYANPMMVANRHIKSRAATDEELAEAEPKAAETNETPVKTDEEMVE